ASELAGNFDPDSEICVNKGKGRAVQLTAAMLSQEDLAVYEEAGEQMWNESGCFRNLFPHACDMIHLVESCWERAANKLELVGVVRDIKSDSALYKLVSTSSPIRAMSNYLQMTKKFTGNRS